MKYKYNQELLTNTLTNWNINIKKELIPLKKLFFDNDNGTGYRYICTRILIL